MPPPATYRPPHPHPGTPYAQEAVAAAKVWPSQRLYFLCCAGDPGALGR